MAQAIIPVGGRQTIPSLFYIFSYGIFSQEADLCLRRFIWEFTAGKSQKFSNTLAQEAIEELLTGERKQSFSRDPDKTPKADKVKRTLDYSGDSFH
ncbi:hypothetical protein OSTOST_17308, partial [Ostertagia ostertagi]